MHMCTIVQLHRAQQLGHRFACMPFLMTAEREACCSAGRPAECQCVHRQHLPRSQRRRAEGEGDAPQYCPLDASLTSQQEA